MEKKVREKTGEPMIMTRVTMGPLVSIGFSVALQPHRFSVDSLQPDHRWYAAP